MILRLEWFIVTGKTGEENKGFERTVKVYSFIIMCDTVEHGLHRHLSYIFFKFSFTVLLIAPDPLNQFSSFSSLACQLSGKEKFVTIGEELAEISATSQTSQKKGSNLCINADIPASSIPIVFLKADK